MANYRDHLRFPHELPKQFVLWAIGGSNPQINIFCGIQRMWGLQSPMAGCILDDALTTPEPTLLVGCFLSHKIKLKRNSRE